MAKPDLILIGCGGHAHACIDVVEQQGLYKIAGLVGMANEMNSKHFGYPVIATDENLDHLVSKYANALIAVGQIKYPDNRINIYKRLTELGFKLPTIISPTAYVSPLATIGFGTVIMHGAIVNAGAKVGDNCIINTHALIEHDVVVENNCHISTGAILNGNVHVGDGGFIGSGSVVKEGVSFGKNCVVGMNLSIRHNQPNYARFVGESANDK